VSWRHFILETLESFGRLKCAVKSRDADICPRKKSGGFSTGQMDPAFGGEMEAEAATDWRVFTCKSKRVKASNWNPFFWGLVTDKASREAEGDELSSRKGSQLSMRKFYPNRSRVN
jgi:hypothetical protein